MPATPSESDIWQEGIFLGWSHKALPWAVSMRSARIAFAFLLLSAVAAQAQWYVISTYAGGGPPATPARGVDVPISHPQSVATDAAGNLYFIGLGGVFKLDRDSILTRVAVNPHNDESPGDGGAATSAGLSAPVGLASDAEGNLFISDSG